MSEIERLLHNLVSATANLTTARGMAATLAETQRDEAVKELAAWLSTKPPNPTRPTPPPSSND